MRCPASMNDALQQSSALCEKGSNSFGQILSPAIMVSPEVNELQCIKRV